MPSTAKSLGTSLREKVLEQKEATQQQQVVRLLWLIRKAVDGCLMAFGEDPHKLATPPDPETGCSHAHQVEVTTMGAPRREFLCADCDKRLYREWPKEDD